VSDFKEEIIRKMINENSYERFNIENGYQGEIKRHPQLLHLCGYVYVPKTSLLFGMDYSDIYNLEDGDSKILIHGGLTYSGAGHKGKDSGEWCFGFDCAHMGDISGYMLFEDHPISFAHDEYRDWEYVKGEVFNLFRQLKSLEEKEGK
jgi:hypothetical protein